MTFQDLDGEREPLNGLNISGAVQDFLTIYIDPDFPQLSPLAKGIFSAIKQRNKQNLLTNFLAFSRFQLKNRDGDIDEELTQGMNEYAREILTELQKLTEIPWDELNLKLQALSFNT